MPDLIVDHVAKQYPTRSAPLSVLARHLPGVVGRREPGRVWDPADRARAHCLYVIGTLDPPTAGACRIAGRIPYTLSEPDLARFRNQHIGFIFQDHHLLPQLIGAGERADPGLGGGQGIGPMRTAGSRFAGARGTDGIGWTTDPPNCRAASEGAWPWRGP